MNAPNPPSQAPDGASLDMLVDGHHAELAEVSSTRALLHCEAALKPDQRVRVTFRAHGTVLRTSARVSTARLEMTRDGARYRVELAFDSDTAAIEKLLA